MLESKRIQTSDPLSPSSSATTQQPTNGNVVHHVVAAPSPVGDNEEQQASATTANEEMLESKQKQTRSLPLSVNQNEPIGLRRDHAEGEEEKAMPPSNDEELATMPPSFSRRIGVHGGSTHNDLLESKRRQTSQLPLPTVAWSNNKAATASTAPEEDGSKYYTSSYQNDSALSSNGPAVVRGSTTCEDMLESKKRQTNQMRIPVADESNKEPDYLYRGGRDVRCTIGASGGKNYLGGHAGIQAEAHEQNTSPSFL